MIIEVVLFGAIIFLLLWMLTQKPEKFPPGPMKLPIVGSMFEMRNWGTLPHQVMCEATRRYGNIVGMYTGRSPVILISGLDLIKEVSSKEEFSARPVSIIQSVVDKGHYGVLTISGDKWKDQRRFTLRHLRDLGFGKRSLEGIAQEELQVVFEEVETLSGGQKNGWPNPIVFHDLLGAAGINVLWHIIAGQRYSHSDPYFNQLIKHVKSITKLSDPSGGGIVAYPNLSRIFPFLTNLGELVDVRNAIIDFIMAEVERHRETLDPENPRDFIDVYISEIAKQKGNPASYYEDKQLIYICGDLFIAGTDTTFNSITYALLYMLLYPEVQKKVQEELDRVVGKDRLPSLEDRPSLHYIEATLHESLRLNNVAPLAIPHATLHNDKDIEFQGYIIPKDSRLILNLHELHHDPKIWGDPENFRPERFLDENGKFFKHESLLPFGSGKRVCLGESLARNNLFIFFTGLMQRYSMKIPDGYPTPSKEPEGGFTLGPKPFHVKIQVRQ